MVPKVHMNSERSYSHCGCSAHSSPAHSIPSMSCNHEIFCQRTLCDNISERENSCRFQSNWIKIKMHPNLMMLSSICISDVAAYSLPRSASPMLLEFRPSKLLLLIKTVKVYWQFRAGIQIFATPVWQCQSHIQIIAVVRQWKKYCLLSWMFILRATQIDCNN